MTTTPEPARECVERVADKLLACPFCGDTLRKMSEGQGYWHGDGNCTLADFAIDGSSYATERWNAYVDRTVPNPQATAALTAMQPEIDALQARLATAEEALRGLIEWAENADTTLDGEYGSGYTVAELYEQGLIAEPIAKARAALTDHVGGLDEMR